MRQKSTFTTVAACTAALFMFAGTVLGQSTGSDAQRGGDAPRVQIIDSATQAGPTVVAGSPAQRQAASVLQPPQQTFGVGAGGIAGGGDCAGNCGGGFGDPGCFDDFTCICYCDDGCFGFGDCCADVCDDCPALVGCDDDVVYSNITNWISGTLQNFPSTDLIYADDLAMIGGGSVTDVTFSIIHNATSTLQSVNVDFHFWELEVDGDGFIQEPVVGQEIAVITNQQFDNIGLAAFPAFGLQTLSDPNGLFNAPVNELAGAGTSVIWAGVKFNSATFSGAGTLANVGQAIFSPPTVGTSANVLWIESFGLAQFTGGTPPANLGWEIRANQMGGCCLEGVAPPCPADLTGDGFVNVFDLLELLGAWGSCPNCAACPADLNGDCNVNVFDLLELLGAWGACPTAAAAGTGCLMLSEDECAAEGGQYAGNGVQCDWPDLCNVLNDPTGACCLPDGSCIIANAGDCAAQDGAFAGGFIACESVTCSEPIDCPTGAIQEQEVCGDDTNNGCFVDVNFPPMENISCGDTICGTLWVEIENGTVTNDTDWYRLDVFIEPIVAEWCVEAEWPVLVGIVDTGGNDFCPNANVEDPVDLIAGAVGPANTQICVSASLGFGTWYLVVQPAVAGDLPCGSPVGNNYIANLNCSGSCLNGCGQGLAFGPDCDPQTGIGCCFCDPGCFDDDTCCEDVCDICPFDECPDENSCADTGSCGAQAPGGCWCDEACCGLSDCCADKFDTCGGCNPDAEATCAGFCGGQSDQGCWCDEDCCANGDCCPDKFDECEGCNPFPACGDAGSGDCCFPSATPSCEDAACCDAVCACDPFCCDTAWDALCVGPNDEVPGCSAIDLCDCSFDCTGCADCPSGGVPENEVCGGDGNTGCGGGAGAPPGGFQFVNHGDVVCGSAWAAGGTRDTDWYRVTVGPSGTVSATLESDGPQVVFIVTSTDWSQCSGIAVTGEIGHSNNCDPGVATATGLTPGQEVVVFTAFGNPDGSGVFEGFPCGSCDGGGDWEYTLEISAP